MVKEQVLSAFLDDIFKGIHDVPQISGLDDFVLSRQITERGKDTASYEVLTDDQVLKNVAGSWAVLFVQFKDDSGARDVTVSGQFTGPSFIYLQAKYSQLRSLSLHFRTKKRRCLAPAHLELKLTRRWTWMAHSKRAASEEVNERRWINAIELFAPDIERLIKRGHSRSSIILFSLALLSVKYPHDCCTIYCFTTLCELRFTQK